MTARRLVAMNALVMFAVATGCGGGDGQAETAPPTPNDLFRADADEVCTRGAERIATIERQALEDAAGGASADEAGPDRATIAEVAADTLTAYEKLKPTPSLRDKSEAFIEQRRRANDALSALAEATLDSDADAARAERDRALREAERVATELGFEECAGKLPNEEADEIETTVERVLTASGPAACRRLVTTLYLADEYGDTGTDPREACLSGSPKAESVAIASTRGAGGAAEVRVEVTGGTLSGQSLDVILLDVDGTWKVQRLEEVPEAATTTPVPATAAPIQPPVQVPQPQPEPQPQPQPEPQPQPPNY